jgi:hypothetical protein
MDHIDEHLTTAALSTDYPKAIKAGLARERDGLPWGFPGQPVPAPVETHTRSHGCGFSRVRGVGLVKPEGSQTHTDLG